VGDPNDVRTWPVLRPLSPHAQAVSSFADAAGITNPTARLMNQLVILLKATNRLREAEPLMARVVQIYEASLGGNHPNVAVALNNLAQLLQDTNRLGEAEPLMCRALGIVLEFERRHGFEHPHKQDALIAYRVILQETGKSPSEIEAEIAELEAGLR
jgi:hypothetical protein